MAACHHIHRHVQHCRQLQQQIHSTTESNWVRSSCDYTSSAPEVHLQTTCNHPLGSVQPTGEGGQRWARLLEPLYLSLLLFLPTCFLHTLLLLSASHPSVSRLTLCALTCRSVWGFGDVSHWWRMTVKCFLGPGPVCYILTNRYIHETFPVEYLH